MRAAYKAAFFVPRGGVGHLVALGQNKPVAVQGLAGFVALCGR